MWIGKVGKRQEYVTENLVLSCKWYLNKNNKLSYNDHEYKQHHWNVWTQTEQEELIQWLEESHNLQKMKKSSGISRKAIIAEIATRIPLKPAVKQILSDQPNVWPRALYNSGCEGQDTTSTVKGLLNAITRTVGGRGGRNESKEAKEQEGEGKGNEEEVERYGEESNEVEEQVVINWGLGEEEEVEEIQEGEREEVVFEGEKYSEERGEIREEEDEGIEVRRENREDGWGRQGDGRSTFKAGNQAVLLTLGMRSSRKHCLLEIKVEDDNDGDADTMSSIGGLT
ncbi:hypothetical protein L873DRAFT_1846824 [Choiromyces venosus 120613-1]|uniref:Uncharacterized protein n=1 Tax=Choiromyces venosus 120613-1 TaxID=1336337 RepID=A0A3N4JAQ1_9PEZI|nr:hypothetical protein L873DRAFT_1846824 [Choiromyces venosus 120613-1]